MKKKFFIISLFFSFLIFLTKSAMAHCPLCAMGAAAAAGGAVWLGVSKVVVALFIGAFASSMGWWTSKIIKKQYIPNQKLFIIIIVSALTLIPMLPMLKQVVPLYLPFIGAYGKTYAINLSLLSSVFGLGIVSISPFISKKLTNARRKTIPFQGTMITLALLITAGIVLQFIIK